MAKWEVIKVKLLILSLRIMTTEGLERQQTQLKRSIYGQNCRTHQKFNITLLQKCNNIVSN